MPKHDAIDYPLKELRHWVEVEHWSQNKIAEHLRRTLDSRVTHKLIYKVCKKHGIKFSPIHKSGADHPEWKGGRRLTKAGYIHIYCPDHPYRAWQNKKKGKRKRAVAEHRLVMEKHLGRYLMPWEVVHHKNKIKTDNRIENLRLFATNADHLRHELKGRCPKWTEHGKRNLRPARTKYSYNQTGLKQGDYQKLRDTARLKEPPPEFHPIPSGTAY